MQGTRRRQEVLAWPAALDAGARATAEGLAVERPWGAALLRSPDDLAAGWWRLRLTGEGPVELELRRVGAAAVRFLTLRPGAAATVRLEAGRHEARLWAGARPGRRRLRVILEPAGPLAGAAARAAGALRLLRRAGPRAVLTRLAGRVPAEPAPPPRAATPPVRPEADAEALIAAAFAANPHWLACYGDGVRDGRYLARPAWDPDLALRQAYAGAAVAFRDGARPDPVAAHARLLELHRRAGPEVIGHVPLALAAEAGPVDLQALAAVVTAHLAALGEAAEARPREDGLGLEVTRCPAPWPAVSLIVPTRDRAALLDGCLGSVFAHTDYADLEMVVVDNGSRDPAALASLARWAERPEVRVLRRDEPFNFARLCNAAAETARGDVLVLLNDDVLAIEPGWLRALVGEATRPEIGAVGALLLYPDRTVQHAGMALGPHGHAGHPWRGLPAESADEPRVRLAGGRSAVTGACLAVRAEAWRAVGGMDEAFAVTFNDVDLCLRLAQRGWRTLYQPAARLIHLESQTRTPDHRPENRTRRDREAQAFLDRWAAAVADDPFWPPALARSDESGRARAGFGEAA